MTNLKIDPRNVLFLVDIDDSTYLDLSQTSDHWNIVSEVLDFRELHASIERIGNLARAHDIDFLLYSQNDQVGKRIGIGAIHQQLVLGYSSISAIDRGIDVVRREQTQACYGDFLQCNGSFQCEAGEKPTRESPPAGTGTFSLVFDTEQLGGVRYGLPRLISLLSDHHIRATFFVTDLVNRVYPNLFGTLVDLGHELAPHGLCHEHLTPLVIDHQVSQVQAMIDGLGTQPTGANFIFRMNLDTLTALVRSGIRYFVYFDTNYYRLISYPKRPTQPTLVQHEEGQIWAIPISVQTYGLPWFSIRNMLDTAIKQGRTSGFEHISVLMHPFRDGALQNIDTTRKIIDHLLESGLQPLTLSDVEADLSENGTFAPQPCDPEKMIDPYRPPVSLPTTRWDFMGFIPQTAMSIIRRIRKGSLY